jgi:DNA-binding NarL/FixJ family response regulator
MGQDLVLLEDTPGRVRAVERWIKDRPELTLIHRAKANDLIAWLEEHLADAVLISLDYHLGGAGPGAGSGFDVALWLARQEPTCPVIIHTSDRTAGTYLSEALKVGGWTTVGAAFSEESWGRLAREQLAG